MRRRFGSWLGAAGGTVLVAVMGAMAGCFHATEVRVVVTTTARCEDGIETQIFTGTRSDGDFGKSPVTTTNACATVEPRIGTLTVVPSGARDDRFDVEVVGLIGAGVDASTCRTSGQKSCIIARRRVSFRPHEALTLPILLSDRCIGVPCGVDQTCDLGTCTPSEGCNQLGCPRERGDVDAGASCVADLATDSTNCGRCGHDCLGGACRAGKCQPTVFVDGETKPSGVTNDGVELFWTTLSGEVKAKRLDGGSALRTVASLGFGAQAADHLEVDDAFVYVATYANRRIVRLPKTGGPPTTLVSCAGDCLGVALRDGALYYTDRGLSALRLIEPSGAVSDVAVGLVNPEDAFATATDVFIADENANRVVRVPRTARSAVPTLVVSVTDPVAVAVDGPSMWVVSQTPGIIYTVPVAGGPLEIVASAQGGPVGITLTPTAIYWTTVLDGRIVRLAR